MEDQKFDSGLRSALRKEGEIPGRLFTVFIHTSAPIDEAQARFLGVHGVKAKPGMRVMTGNLSPDAIRHFADQEWVSAIRLSRKMHPV